MTSDIPPKQPMNFKEGFKIILAIRHLHLHGIIKKTQLRHIKVHLAVKMHKTQSK